MNNIDQRFLDNLFDSKNVACFPELYVRLFHKMWPCEEYFRNFLASSDPSLKLDYAKKIFAYMQTYSDVIIPSYYINKVISLQQEKLVSNNKFIPQDHVIHSINLYILGIYLFFNYPLFNKKLISSMSISLTLHDRIYKFVRNWRLFALYHDVGYYLESNVNEKGYSSSLNANALAEYQNMYDRMIYYLILRSAARLIALISLTERSNTYFHLMNYTHITNAMWKTYDGKEITKASLTNSLEQFEEATLLQDIDTVDGFSHFSSIFSNASLLVVICNEVETPVCLTTIRCNQITNIYFQDNAHLERLNPDSINTLAELSCKMPPLYKYQFFIPQLRTVIKKNLPVQYRELAFDFYNDLPQSLKQQFSYISTDQQIEDCILNIYNWLEEKTLNYALTESFSDSHRLLVESMSTYYKAGLLRQVQESLKQALESKMLTYNDLEKTLQLLTSKLKDKSYSSMLVERTQENAIENYNINNGVPQNILGYCTHSYAQTKKSILTNPDSPMYRDWSILSFITTSASQITVNLFAHDNENLNSLFENQLYAELEEHAKNLNISLDDLVHYSTNYSNCDHGLISAGILFQSMVFCQHLAKYSKQHTDLSLAWCNNRNNNIISLYDDSHVVFAILLHNIYTKNAREYGINYKQNIDKNPFSYFCAFCDSLQVWNRPKQIDSSIINLPEINYLSDSFDISISSDKIQLYCAPKDAQSLRKMLTLNEDFLPGLDRILKINENSKKP